MGKLQNCATILDLPLLFWQGLTLSLRWSGAHYIFQASLQLTAVLLPMPLKCWDYWQELPCSAISTFIFYFIYIYIFFFAISTFKRVKCPLSCDKSPVWECRSVIPSTQEAEARKPHIQGQSGPQNKFKSSLGDLARSCLKKQIKSKTGSRM